MDFPPTFSSAFSDVMGPSGKDISKRAAEGLRRAAKNSLLSDGEDENLWFLFSRDIIYILGRSGRLDQKCENVKCEK